MTSRLEHQLARIPDDWGKEIRFEEGWDEIVEDLDYYLSRLFPEYEIHQMKEKFGKLRFYWHPGESIAGVTDHTIRVNYEEGVAKANVLVQAAEIKSGMTCETCGRPGHPVSVRGWYKTACDACERERLQQ